MIECPNGHSGARITAVGGAVVGPDAVNTITLDDLAVTHFGGVPERLLIKLDVEGAEINAFRGATRILATDALFYYEDHGLDAKSEVTEHVLRELGLDVFYSRNDGSLLRIRSASEASRIKKSKTYGYNFLACKRDSRFLDSLRSEASR